MERETDNLSPEGTDDAIPEQADTAPDWDYYDPDDDQDTVEDQDEATDDGTESADEPEEEAEPDAETAEEEPEDDPDEADAEPEIFELADGTKADRDEVIRGYMRQQDYTRKTQEVATKRKEVEANVQRIEGITETFIDHLTTLIPNEPSAQLAYQNPQEYTRQKAAYDAAINQVQKLIEMGGQAKEAKESVSDANRQEVLQAENAKLMEKFPDLAKPEKREHFFKSASEAANELGFSMEELGQVSDHRLFALAHWAKEGMKAAKSRDKAKAKVAKAPPVAQRKPGQGKRSPNRNAEAMRKLNRSGSIRDALAIDFD